MGILARITAHHSGLSVDLAGDDGFTLLAEGASLGHPVSKPVFGKVFDSDRVVSAGESFDGREIQLPVMLDADTRGELQSRLDLLDRVLRDAARWGGDLEYRSDETQPVTRFRIGGANRGGVNLAEYEAFGRARFPVNLVVDPFGLGVETVVASVASASFPRVLTLDAPGGTHDALASVSYTRPGNDGDVHAMLLAWWPTPEQHNACWNEGAERASETTTAHGWSNAAVSDVIAACTSVERTVLGRTGFNSFVAVCPTTANCGPSYTWRRAGGFAAGTIVTGRAWVRAESGTEPVRAVIGSAAGGAGSPVTLSTSWQLIAASWTVDVDVDEVVFAIDKTSSAAQTILFDDVEVFEGVAPPRSALGGHGPGVIPAAAGVSQGFTETVDADYLFGTGLQLSGVASGGPIYPILPHLFPPDEYARDTVDCLVFARLEVASTQTGLTCAMRIVSDYGGEIRYGSYGALGKPITLPSTGTCFRTVCLGRIGLRVDRENPRREWLQLYFANSGVATGTIGVDYLAIVPAKRTARTPSGLASASIPQFSNDDGVTRTKRVNHDLSGQVLYQDAWYDDDSLGGAMIRIPAGASEMLVWPSSMVVDDPDSSALSVQKVHEASVEVVATPRFHLLAGGM